MRAHTHKQTHTHITTHTYTPRETITLTYPYTHMHKRACTDMHAYMRVHNRVILVNTHACAHTLA